MLKLRDNRQVFTTGTCSLTLRFVFAKNGKTADLKNGSALWLVFVAFLICVAHPFIAQTPAPAATADAYVQQFEASYHEVRSLRAEFSQAYTQSGSPPRIE